MGEIAQDIVEGQMCQCGTYFEKVHGYPVLCGTCYDDLTPKERTELGVQRATEKEL